MYVCLAEASVSVLCISSHAAHGTCTATEMSITKYLLVQGAASSRGIGELDVSNAYRMFMRSRNTGNTGFDKVTRCFGCWHTVFKRYIVCMPEFYVTDYYRTRKSNLLLRVMMLRTG